MSSCNCHIALANLGIKECPIDSFGAIAGMLFFPTYNEDGINNYLLVQSGGITQELLESLLYAENPYDRFQNLFNVIDAKIENSENEYILTDNKERYKVSFSPMKFSCVITHNSFNLAKQLQNLSCDDVSVLFYDENNNILGIDSHLTNMYGLEINMETFDPNYEFAEKNVKDSKITLSFDFKIQTKQEDFFVIPSEFVTANLNTNSMIDVNITNNGSIENTIKIIASLPFNNAFVNTLYVGKDDKFTLKNIFDDLVSITAVEVSDGHYELSGIIPSGTYLIEGNDYENGFNIKQTTITI